MAKAKYKRNKQGYFSTRSSRSRRALWMTDISRRPPSAR